MTAAPTCFSFLSSGPKKTNKQKQQQERVEIRPSKKRDDICPVYRCVSVCVCVRVCQCVYAVYRPAREWEGGGGIGGGGRGRQLLVIYDSSRPMKRATLSNDHAVSVALVNMRRVSICERIKSKSPVTSSRR